MGTRERRELRARIRAVPPRCIRGFRATMYEPYEYQCGGIQPHWWLACACGGTVGAILGRTLEDPLGNRPPRGLGGPLAFECATCRATTEIIDPARHGCRAELARLKGAPEAVEVFPRPRDRYACRHCGQSRSQNLAAAFGSWDAAYELAEKDPDTPLSDFFKTFSLRAGCENCRRQFWTMVARFDDL